MSTEWKKRSWIVFGILALAYSGFGIYLDNDATKSEQTNRGKLESQITSLSTAVQAVSTTVGTVRSELETVRGQNLAMLQFAEHNLTKEQAQKLFLVSARAASTGTQELRQKEYALAKQLRKLPVDLSTKLKDIEANCASQGRNRGPSCGIVATHDEIMDYEKVFREQYLPQAVGLRDAMLVKLPSQPPPRQEITNLFNGSPSPSELADYLDELALKLP